MPRNESGAAGSGTEMSQEARGGDASNQSASIEGASKEITGEGSPGRDPFKDDLMDRAAAAAVASWFPGT